MENLPSAAPPNRTQQEPLVGNGEIGDSGGLRLHSGICDLPMCSVCAPAAQPPRAREKGDALGPRGRASWRCVWSEMACGGGGGGAERQRCTQIDGGSTAARAAGPTRCQCANISGMSQHGLPKANPERCHGRPTYKPPTSPTPAKSHPEFIRRRPKAMERPSENVPIVSNMFVFFVWLRRTKDRDTRASLPNLSHVRGLDNGVQTKEASNEESTPKERASVAWRDKGKRLAAATPVHWRKLGGNSRVLATKIRRIWPNCGQNWANVDKF